MGHRMPLYANATALDVVRHRQAMVNMAAPIRDEDGEYRGNVRGFRPAYMERVLVRLGHADPSLAFPDLSKRSKRKAAAKADFRERFKKYRGQGFYS